MIARMSPPSSLAVGKQRRQQRAVREDQRTRSADMRLISEQKMALGSVPAIIPSLVRCPSNLIGRTAEDERRRLAIPCSPLAHVPLAHDRYAAKALLDLRTRFSGDFVQV